MDGTGGYTVLHSHSPNDKIFTVVYDPLQYGRILHPDLQVEREVRNRWQLAKLDNPALFNTSKFRFHALDTKSDTVTLTLGLTNYAQFIGTHKCENPKQSIGLVHMALPIGNATVCTTSDGFIPMLRRSNAVGEGIGHVGFPGGHPEPSQIIGVNECNRNNAVRDELYNAAWREVCEELFIQVNQNQLDLTCIGFVARNLDNKVCQIFTSNLNFTELQLQKSYQYHIKHGDESDKLIFLHTSQMLSVFRNAQVNGMPIMPDHLGALQLWLERKKYLP